MLNFLADNFKLCKLTKAGGGVLDGGKNKNKYT
jgi:hypothetical protein